MRSLISLNLVFIGSLLIMLTLNNQLPYPLIHPQMVKWIGGGIIISGFVHRILLIRSGKW